MTDLADHSTDDEIGRREAPRERPWHDVRTYDTGDGDAAAIGRAVDAAASDGGGIVLLPPGEYRLEGPVTLRSGVRVRGLGIGATTISGEGFGSTEEPLTDIAIEDLAIDCSGLVDAEGESIDDAKPVFWEARAY